MDKAKTPFLPEEALRTQRVEIYLADLKERLKDLRVLHDEVIQNSVDIIKEIDDVSTTLLSTTDTTQSDVTKIKKLINEFESSSKQSNPVKTSVNIESKVDIRRILQNFEKLSDSHVLKESLVLFKRAKESFEKIDTYLGKIGAGNNGGGHVRNISLATKITPNLNPLSEKSLKNRVASVNGRSMDYNKDNNSRYASCCSSLMSIDVFHSSQELTNLEKSAVSKSTLENGYEGDNDDSEYDLLAMKKKKLKA